MSEESLFVGKVKELYKVLCKDEWNSVTAGIIVAFLSVIILAWMRPWGAVGAVRNWGEWIIYGAGLWDTLDLWEADAPRSALIASGSVIGIGFVGGAFLSANLGDNFDIRIPPVLEMVKGVIAGIFMGIGAAFAGGCNVGGMYNALGNLSAHGFTMWLGLIIGVVGGLKWIYWEMEHVTWGSGGAKTIEFPVWLRRVLAIAAIIGFIWGAKAYSEMDAYDGMLSGILLISAGLGYTMQRGRWCMVQGFREPHMTGDNTMARGVMVSILLVAIGVAVIKYTELRPIEHYVRGTFGMGGVVGGILFGFGAMLAGGCGTGTLWRVGEGQVKLWIVVPFFGVSNAIASAYFKEWEWEGTQDAAGVLGKWVFMPDSIGYGWTLAIIAAAMGLWYIIVKWNEDSGKLIVNM